MAVAVTVAPATSYALLPFPAPTPTIEVPGSPLNVSSGATAVASGATAAATAAQTSKDIVGDPVAFLVKNVLVRSLTKSVVTWINSGFNGSPAFEQDLQGSLLRIGDTVATSYINEFASQAGLQNLPWRDEIAQSVLSGYFQSTSKDGFYLQNPYTLDQVSSDPRAFVNGDYSKGGLAAWRELVFNPGANNPLLFRDALRESLNSRISSARGDRVGELNRSNGFNSFRGNCNKPTSSILGGRNANTGNVLSLNSGAVGDAPSPDNFGSILKGATPVNTGNTRGVSLTNTDNCLGSPILTPGSLIAQSANKYLVDNGLEQYIAADEVGEIVNALVGQLVNNVLGSGGLAGVSRPTSGGGASYSDRLGNDTSSGRALSKSFSATISNQVVPLTEYKANWQKISDAAAAANTSYPGACNNLAKNILTQAGIAVSSATSAISSLQKIQSDLTKALVTNDSSQTETLTVVSEQYQAFQTSGTLPSIADFQYAKSESADRQADTANGVSASLYTQMVQLQSTGTCPQ